jgi:hypothetical protein
MLKTWAIFIIKKNYCIKHYHLLAITAWKCHAGIAMLDIYIRAWKKNDAEFEYVKRISIFKILRITSKKLNL